MHPSPFAGLADYLAPIRARAPHEGDADFLARLYASTRLDLHSITADPAFVKSIIEMQQRLQAAGYRQSFPDAEYHVLEVDGVACGRLVLAAAAGQLRLVDIALLPESRGQGMGRRVLRALQACATAHAAPLALSVHHSNPNARRLYQALGFRTHNRDELAEQMVWNNEGG